MRHALLSLVFWPAVTQAIPRIEIRLNSSSSASNSSASTTPDAATLPGPSYDPPSNATILSTSSMASLSSTIPTTSTSSSDDLSSRNSTITASSQEIGSSLRTANSTITASSQELGSSRSTANSTTFAASNSSTSDPIVCTGCVLQAIKPTTITYEPTRTIWQDVKVTVTVVSSTITYMDGSSIDTVVTEYETRTQKVHIPANQTVVSTTPVFTWVPVAGTTVTFKVGPTYVAYTDIYGGLDFPWLDPTDVEMEEPGPTETNIPTLTVDGLLPITPFESDVFESEEPEQTCDAQVHLLPVWPTETKGYNFYIQTFEGAAPSPESPGMPISLPAPLIEHLRTNPTITSIFNGSDIATCTLRATSQTTRSSVSFTDVAPTSFAESPTPPPAFSPTTSKYISKTYESTSTHVTVQGCLRCSKPPTPPKVTPEKPDISNEVVAPPTRSPEPPPQPPKSVRPPPPDRPKQTQKNPGIQDRPSITNGPQSTANPPPRPNDRGQSITIGDRLVDVRPAQPTRPSQQNDPNREQPRPQNPGIVIDSQTLTPGQTTTINGVQVIVPTDNSGPNRNIIVDGSTVAVNPMPTGPPVLTVGESTITANSQGQFIVGTQTLTPGGGPITVDGSTLSLGPSGTIAIVNGVTQTLANAPLPTGAPILTVNGQTVSPTVVGGTTQFVLAPGQTLTPGGVLTVDGTTISMPSDGSGSTIVVNGITSTLDAPGLPVMTLNSDSVTATVVDGTTAFVLGPGQTLTPGAVLTVDGTTFSMPEGASGSVVVVNGVTSTLGQGDPIITSAPALTIDGKTYSATVRDGTTEYVLGEGTTLRPGEALTMDGTTYSLDPDGTALVVNGKTSSLPTGPARNTARTTEDSSSSLTTTSTARDPGDFIASGIGISSKAGGVVSVRVAGIDSWVEGVVIVVGGWFMMLV